MPLDRTFLKYTDPSQRPAPWNFIFADASDRAAGIGYDTEALSTFTITFSAADVSEAKVALQLDDGTEWVITDISPLTWRPRVASDASKVPTTRTVNGHALSSDVTVTEADVTGLFYLREPVTSGFTADADDHSILKDATNGTFTIALTAAATLGNNWKMGVFNSGSGVVTIDPDGSETIRDQAGSATTKTLSQGEAGIIFCDGAGFLLLKFPNFGATLDTDGTLAANSDAKVASQKAVVTYVAAQLVALGAGDMLLSGVQTVTGAKTFNDAKLILAGATSGTTTVKTAAVAGTTTVTLPGATDTLVGKATTDTLTNKRITPRVDTTASSATPAINTDTTDLFTITALATAITSMTSSLTGTPANGEMLMIRIKDDGTARAIAWGASYASRGATLPTTTVISKTLYVLLIWNSTASTWDCVSTAQEA